MENSSLDFYNFLQEELKSAPSIEARREVKINYLSRILRNLKDAELNPPGNMEKEVIKGTQDLSAKYIFLMLPESVTTIVFPNKQQVSRQSSIPEEKQKTWDMTRIDVYRGKLLKLSDKPWTPIFK